MSAATKDLCTLLTEGITLTHLDLSHCHLTVTDLCAIAESVKQNKQLTRLTLANTEVIPILRIKRHFSGVKVLWIQRSQNAHITNIERFVIVESRGFDALKCHFISEDWYKLYVR